MILDIANKFSFISFLNGYWNTCGQNACSLHSFRASSAEYKELIVRRGTLLQKSIEMLDEAYKLMAGHDLERSE